MKILPIERVREADDYTIKNEPVKSIDLMERAATECYKWIQKNIKKKQTIKIFCGLGNNGGDGLGVARLLADKKYKIELFIVRYSDKCSKDFKINFERISDYKNIRIIDIKENDKLPEINKNDIVIDALFGSGLSKPVKGFIANVIENINKSKAIIISIDMPSGLFSDVSSLGIDGAIIKADYTLSFQFPKFAFMFPENDKYVGHWYVLPIGLHPEFIKSVKVKNFYLEKEDCIEILKTRNKFAHKGNFGHALLISGSYGKMGAAVLASKACLRAGVGLLTTHIPAKGNDILQISVPEAMVSIDMCENYFSEVPDLAMFNAIGVGPGIGQEKQTQNALKLLIQNSGVPIVFDADAINILGENKTWIPFIPKHSIFTPHPKEFERLVGKANNDFERNKLQLEFSFKYQVYVVLKGANTAITTPLGNTYFNSTGNPGMATGGSGDVLTGIILGLLTQKYTSLEACVLGVYIHGLAGDIAASKVGEEALIAGDLVKYMGKAFKKIKDIHTDS